jgi:SM-20-related protein
MTAKEVLDSFSETLMQDERILSVQEQALLTNLLQHAKAMASSGSSERQGSVWMVIASAVGETVAQRAFSVLGASIVEKILEGSPIGNGASSYRPGEIYAGGNPGSEPQPPAGPRPPGVRAPQKPKRQTPTEPQPPGRQPQPPAKEPQPPVGEPQPPAGEPQPPALAPYAPPTPKEPQPPAVRAPRKAPMREAPLKEPQPPAQRADTSVFSETSVEVAERPPVLPAQCVVLDEFLAPQELERLTRFALDHENEFDASEVVSPLAEKGVVNYEHRRSRVLMDIGDHQALMLDRIQGVLPHVLEKLRMENFSIAGVEMQITASNDGDFFRFHSDNGSERVSARHLTFVYFFHREPRQFEGGELRIHDARREGEHYVSQGSYQRVVPQQNQIVFFPCELMHEITTVECGSGLFADSRFTLNGWLRR